MAAPKASRQPPIATTVERMFAGDMTQ
jgi:hypothetical protein